MPTSERTKKFWRIGLYYYYSEYSQLYQPYYVFTYFLHASHYYLKKLPFLAGSRAVTHRIAHITRRPRPPHCQQCSSICSSCPRFRSPTAARYLRCMRIYSISLATCAKRRGTPGTGSQRSSGTSVRRADARDRRLTETVAPPTATGVTTGVDPGVYQKSISVASVAVASTPRRPMAESASRRAAPARRQGSGNAFHLPAMGSTSATRQCATAARTLTLRILWAWAIALTPAFAPARAIAAATMAGARSAAASSIPAHRMSVRRRGTPNRTDKSASGAREDVGEEDRNRSGRSSRRRGAMTTTCTALTRRICAVNAGVNTRC